MSYFGLPFGNRKSRFASPEAIFEAFSNSQAIISFSPDGIVLDANAKFLNLTGYGRDEIVGKHHRTFVALADQDAGYQRFWDDLRAGRFQTGEFRRMAKGGGDIWLQASYNVVTGRGGRAIQVVKIASDITAAKLRAADAEGQIAAIGKAQAVISFDLDGHVLDANDNFLSVLGYRLEEVKGQHHRVFVAAEESADVSYQKFWAALRRGEFQAAQYRRVGKGGREVWIQATYNPILDLAGRPFKVVKFATDITAVVAEQRRRQEVQRGIDQDLTGITEAVSSATQEATEAAAASSQTSSNVQAVAAGAEELSSSVLEISRQVGHSREIVDKAVEEATRTNAIVAGLSAAAQRIGDVVQLINVSAKEPPRSGSGADLRFFALFGAEGSSDGNFHIYAYA